MTKFNKFKKMCELIIELAELATIEGVDGAEAMSIRNHMEALCPDEYVKVKDTLFPQAYYPYAYSPNPNSYRPYFNGHDLFENSNNYWNSPWTPDSPVPVRPVTGNNESINNAISGMRNETTTISESTDFINSIKEFLPQGYLKRDFSTMGEIINAIRDNEFTKAVKLVKDNWVSSEEEQTSCSSDNSEKKPWDTWDPHFDSYNPRESEDELREDNNEDITD